MKKKLVGLFMVVLMILGQKAYANIDVTTISRSDFFDTVTINITNDESDGWLTLHVYSDDGEQVCFMSQDRLAAENTFSFSFSPTDKRFDFYTVKVTKISGGKTIIEEKEFEYFTYAQQQDAIESILSSGTISEINAKILSLPIQEGTLYYELSDKKEVVEILKLVSDLKPENILKVFNNAVTKAALKSKNPKTLRLLVQSYRDILSLDTHCVDELEWYIHINNLDSFYKRLAKKSYRDAEAFCQEFSAQCFLFELSNQPYSNLQAFLIENNNKYSQEGFVLNLPIDEMIQKLKTNDKVEKVMYALSDICYEDLKALKEAFEQAVLDVSKTENNSSSGRQGTAGAGPTSSGSVSLNIQSVADEVKTDTFMSFTDIGETPWAMTAITNLAAEGILTGVGGGKFEPQQLVTREQFAKIVVLAFDIAEAKNTIEFLDTVKDSWYIPFVSASYEAGIMIGNGKTFGINEAISRQDIAVVLYRILKSSNISIPEFKKNVFLDSGSIADYAKDAVSTLYSIGLISGVGDNIFAPTKFATRAETAKLVYELRNYIKEHN